jgi:predicted ABC-type ATPase
MTDRPVLTIFAGPNGSGKTTLQKKIARSGHDLGIFVNADEIVLELTAKAKAAGLQATRQAVELQAFHEAERRRQVALTGRDDFSFETVFSHPSKLEFIAAAKACSFEQNYGPLCANDEPPRAGL